MDYIASSIYGLGSFPPTHTHTNTKVPGRVVCVLSSSCNPQKTKTKLAGTYRDIPETLDSKNCQKLQPLQSLSGMYMCHKVVYLNDFSIFLLTDWQTDCGVEETRGEVKLKHAWQLTTCAVNLPEPCHNKTVCSVRNSRNLINMVVERD